MPSEAIQDHTLWHSIWTFIQQLVTLIVGLGAIWVTMVRPWLKRSNERRKAELALRDEKRKAEIVAQVEAVVKPVRDQVEAIHRTTHINGGKSDPPTLRDEVNNVGKQVDTAIKSVGAVAVNQAYLSARFDQHERDGEKYLAAVREALAAQGIELPDVRSSLPPDIDD